MKSPALKGVLFGALALAVSGGGTAALIGSLHNRMIWKPAEITLNLSLIIMPIISILLGFSIAKQWRILRIITTTLILLNIFIVAYFFVGTIIENHYNYGVSIPFIPGPTEFDPEDSSLP